MFCNEVYPMLFRQLDLEEILCTGMCHTVPAVKHLELQELIAVSSLNELGISGCKEIAFPLHLKNCRNYKKSRRNKMAQAIAWSDSPLVPYILSYLLSLDSD